MSETEKRTEKKHGSGLVVTLAVLGWLLLTALVILLIDGRTVRFTMYGDEKLTVEYGSVFTDPGVSAVTTGNLFGDGKTPLEVQTFGTVDTHRLGSYVLRYTARYAFREYETERLVTVADTTPPVIELKHTEGYTPSWMTGYAEEGYTAWDALDGDLTDKVRSERLGDRIRYSVTDSEGNTTSVERILVSQNFAPPEVTLFGDAHIDMEAGLWYTDPGAEVSDSLGTDLSEYLVTEGEVIPWFAGEYTVTYSITNELGETVSAARTVTVHPVPLPETVEPAEKTIYLTFDDGPSRYTGRLLDVLDRYGAKASFFVTAQDPRYYDQLVRAYQGGHAIGVHTTTHDYNRIYSSEQAFFEDFFRMEEVIREQTGSDTRLFRFPGGSSNTVSSFNPGIMSRLTRAMNDMGYQYYDWNVYSGDAGDTTKTDQIIKNIEEGCARQKYSVVLQHDIKDYSVAAVEEILKWGRDNGYSFQALQLDSPAMHHSLNN